MREDTQTSRSEFDRAGWSIASAVQMDDAFEVGFSRRGTEEHLPQALKRSLLDYALMHA